MGKWLLALLVFAPAAFAADLDYTSYFRVPWGTAAGGGKEIQLVNPGSHGNEFRLGNETAYAEAYFTSHVLKGGGDNPNFDANLTLVYNPQMNSQYGDTTANTDYVQVVQAFVEGGNVDGIPASFWIGKRFYRDVNVEMDDLYYFADMSGVGAGVENIPLMGGNLAIALLQHSDNTFTKTTGGALPSKQALDVRLKNMPLSANNKLHSWVAAAYTAPGTGTQNSTSVDYEAAHGFALGARWEHDFDKDSFNNLAIMYGTGVMDSFNLDSSAYAKSGDNTNDRKRLRVVENPVMELGPKWSLAAAGIFETAQSGASTDNKSHWYSLGVRPTYYFTEHLHLTVEAGTSIVHDDSEHAGDRTLNRVTIAPEIGAGKGYFKRPVFRAYVTHSWWNDANADTSKSTSMLGQLNAHNIVALNGRHDETQVGFEAEVWF